jgi:hypothetical protein
MDISIFDVAHKEGVSYYRVHGAMERHVRTSVDWAQLKQLHVLSLDKITLKIWQRKFVVLPIARQTAGWLTLLGVLPGLK